MAKENQQFGVGDIVIVKDCDARAIVRNCVLDEDGFWYYEVEPVDFKSFTREVKQSNLKMA